MVARANKLDYLDMAISDITATVTTADIQAGLTAQGYTAARATKIDNLDTTISSRMATFTYTAPDSAAVTAALVWTNTAGVAMLDKLNLIYTYTNAVTDSGSYTGIEKYILMR